jgi:glycosyltransferase involved in cell wall biosynthesis
MRVLIITSRFPLPARRGNQIRTLEWLRSTEGWTRAVVCPESPVGSSEVGLAGLADGWYTFDSSRTEALRSAATGFVRGRPAQEGLYGVAAARRAAGEAVRDFEPDVVVVQMVRCGWAADLVGHRSAVLFDAIDSMALHFERRAGTAASPLRALWRVEASRCRRRERSLAARAAFVTAVSKRDLESLDAPRERTAVVPVSGADLSDLAPSEGPPTVLLSGNLGYRPTVQAAGFFGAEVWPRLLDRVPDARWLLVGARPAAAVRVLARLPGVEVHGDVEDLGPFMARATVAVAPMNSGSGLPMKVLEAWSAGVPVVADPWGVGGLDEEQLPAVALARSADEWLAAVESLLRDAARARKLGELGRAVWREHFRFDRIARRVRDSLRAADATTERRG